MGYDQIPNSKRTYKIWTLVIITCVVIILLIVLPPILLGIQSVNPSQYNTLAITFILVFFYIVGVGYFIFFIYFVRKHI